MSYITYSVISLHHHILVISSHNISTYSSNCAHITIIKQTRECSSRWSKDNPHNPIERLLQSYVMAIDSTIAFSSSYAQSLCTYNMVLHALRLVYITYIPYLGKRWLSTLTWLVILNPHTQATQSDHQAGRSPITSNQEGNMSIPSLTNSHQSTPTRSLKTHKHTTSHNTYSPYFSSSYKAK